MLAVSFTEGIEEAWSDLAGFVPKLIAALLIFVIGWFIARLIRNVAHRVLTKIGFDGFVDRAGLGAPLERAGYADSGLLLAKIIYWFVMILVLQLAIGAFGDSAVQDTFNDIVDFLPKLFVALIIIVLTGVVASKVKELVQGFTGGLDYGETLATAASAAIWLIGIFAALDQVQIAENIVDRLFTVIVGSLGLILVIKFGVGGIWAARDRFWPAVYDKFSEATGADDSGSGSSSDS